MTDNEPTEIELELTFLANHIPDEVSGNEPKELLDVYVPEDHSVHSKLRLRKKGTSYEITKKYL